MNTQSTTTHSVKPGACNVSASLEILGFEARSRVSVPMFLSAVAAGFPSPADDFIDKTLDLNELLVSNPTATFFVRVSGDSMMGAGMHDGDIIIVDRALTPKNNDVVIAALNGELTVKRIRKRDGAVWLIPENPEYSPVQVTEEMCFDIWGVATNVIHKL